MSRMWLKNGRAVLDNGRAVLCEECPCGCRYTYYVDHSLATSGDGHSWETAFNSVNDVFNSAEIYNYRNLGCKITVYIKGAINYTLSGSYFAYYNATYPDNYMVFDYNVGNGDLVYVSMTTGIYVGSICVEFRHFSFHYTQTGNVYTYTLTRARFINCTFVHTHGAGSTGSQTLLFQGRVLFFNNVNISVNRTILITGSSHGFYLFRETSNSQFYNVVVNCTCSGSENNPIFSFEIMVFAGCTNIIVENVSGTLSVNAYTGIIRGWGLHSVSNSSINNFNITENFVSSREDCSIYFCRFYQSNNNIFYNCTQSCAARGIYVDSNWCANNCQSLS